MATEFVALRDGSEPVRQLLPPGQIDAESSLALVDNGGSFLISRDNVDFTIVQTSWGERYETPCDDTGLPYCFAPTVELPPVRQNPMYHARTSPGERSADLNHQFPKYEVAISDSPALDELGRWALMNARVQWVDFEQHHGPYNNLFSGPRQPQTATDLFKVLAMATAGYVPEHAIDLSGSEPRVVGLTVKKRKWLWTSGQVDVMCQSDVNKCLLSYIVSVDADHIKQTDVEEFLYTIDYDKRLALGHAIVEKLIDRAVEPLEDIYTQARRQNVLTFMKINGRKTGVPNNPRDLVKAKLTNNRLKLGPIQQLLQYKMSQQPRRSCTEYVDEMLTRVA